MLEHKFSNIGGSAPRAAVPKLRDVSTAYAKAFDRQQELEAELARLEGVDPKNPDATDLEHEFRGAGDLDKIEGLRRARIAELRGDRKAAYRDGAIYQARVEADRLREEASRIVCRKVQPIYDGHTRDIASAVHGTLEAIERHDAFLKPLEADGVLIGSLVARGGPTNDLIRQLKQFLRNHERETR